MVRSDRSDSVRCEVRFQILISEFMPQRGKRYLQAAHRGAKRLGLDVSVRNFYDADPGQVLVTYGLGGKDRLPAATAHMAAGGRLVAFDAGYWDRTSSESCRKYRVSLDGFHSPNYLFAVPFGGAQRWRDSGLTISQSGNPAGPIILAGCGPKSNAVGAQGWSARISREIRRTWPDREVLYRPKPRRPPENDVVCTGYSGGDIESALAGASLVVCRHSNVAVDACRMGVPVVCEDGAAAAIYPSTLSRFTEQPSKEIRREFLKRLAWWQWSANECEQGEMWRWLIGALNATSTV